MNREEIFFNYGYITKTEIPSSALDYHNILFYNFQETQTIKVLGASKPWRFVFFGFQAL